MKFKIDENLPVELAELLDRAGHEATTVAAQGLAGAPDRNIAEVCAFEGYALITLDTDFGDIRSYPPREYPGLVVLRPRQQDKAHILAFIQPVIRALAREPLEQQLWIVDEDQIRIRE